MGTDVTELMYRVPEELIEQFSVEALLVDDASDEASFQRAREMRAHRDLPFPVEVLSSTRERGYGGCQKLGLEYAITHHFDYVVIFDRSSDLQPADLPDLVCPLVEDRADATVMAPVPTLRERIASRLVRRILHHPLAALHNGLRAYRVAALEKIPFALDTDERHIDTELLIQLLFSEQRVSSVPVSRDPRPKAARAPSGRHILNALRAVIRARMQQLSLFHERRFDCTPAKQENAHYELKLDFDSSHRRALAHIPPGSKVLDLGCAGGYFSQVLESDLGCTVTAIDREPLARGVSVTESYVWDLDRGPPDLDYGSYDVIVMLDVIEHLRSPEEFVRLLHEKTSQSPSLRLIFTTANIGFFLTRIGLLLGQFNYGKRGILDLTHTRLFTLSTFRRLFTQDGFQVMSQEGVPAPFPLATSNRFLGHSLLALNRSLLRPFPRLLAYQMLLVVEPRASLSYLLDEAREITEAREAKLSARA